jgi:hypothetical protein
MNYRYAPEEMEQERQTKAKTTLKMQTSEREEDERSVLLGCGFAPPPQSGSDPPSTNNHTKFLKE